MIKSPVYELIKTVIIASFCKIVGGQNVSLCRRIHFQSWDDKVTSHQISLSQHLSAPVSPPNQPTKILPTYRNKPYGSRSCPFPHSVLSKVTGTTVSDWSVARMIDAPSTSTFSWLYETWVLRPVKRFWKPAVALDPFSGVV